MKNRTMCIVSFKFYWFFLLSMSSDSIDFKIIKMGPLVTLSCPAIKHYVSTIIIIKYIVYSNRLNKLAMLAVQKNILTDPEDVPNEMGSEAKKSLLL